MKGRTNAATVVRSVRLTITKAAVADDGRRVFEGMASTPTPDLMDDIVVPSGAQYTLPVVLLWMHKADEPAVGRVFEATATAAGIRVKAEIARIDEPGKLKDRLDEAWQAVKARLVALSIGFKPDPAYTDPLPGGGQRFRRWHWVELSLVSCPANREAQIFALATGKGAAARAGNGSRPLDFPPPPPRLLDLPRRLDGLTSTAPPLFERRPDGAVQLGAPRRRKRGGGRSLEMPVVAMSSAGARSLPTAPFWAARRITNPPGSRRLAS